MSKAWTEAQAWELNWWTNASTQWEEEKRKGGIVASMLGIEPGRHFGPVLDVGCGPFSLLLDYGAPDLKVALDPLQFPDWMEQAYRRAGVARWIMRAEDLPETAGALFDEVWMYNCLQHTQDPAQVLRKVEQYAWKTVRIFEWCNIPPYTGHLHTITGPMVAAAFPSAEWERVKWEEGHLDAPGLQGDYVVAVLARDMNFKETP